MRSPRSARTRVPRGAAGCRSALAAQPRGGSSAGSGHRLMRPQGGTGTFCDNRDLRSTKRPAGSGTDSEGSELRRGDVCTKQSAFPAGASLPGPAGHRGRRGGHPPHGAATAALRGRPHGGERCQAAPRTAPPVPHLTGRGAPGHALPPRRAPPFFLAPTPVALVPSRWGGEPRTAPLLTRSLGSSPSAGGRSPQSAAGFLCGLHRPRNESVGLGRLWEPGAGRACAGEGFSAGSGC